MKRGRTRTQGSGPVEGGHRELKVAAQADGKYGCGGQGRTLWGRTGRGRNSIGLCPDSKGKPERGLAEAMSR